MNQQPKGILPLQNIYKFSGKDFFGLNFHKYKKKDFSG